MKRITNIKKLLSVLAVFSILALLCGCKDEQALSSQIINSKEKESIIEKYTEYENFDKSIIKVEKEKSSQEDDNSSQSQNTTSKDNSKAENKDRTQIETPTESADNALSSEEESNTDNEETTHSKDPNDDEENWKSNNGKFY